MDLSRRGFFKGLLGIAAGVAAAQLPNCGGPTLAVANAPWWKSAKVEHTIGPVVANERRPGPTLKDLKKISAELIKNAVHPAGCPAILTASEVRMDRRLDRDYVAKGFLPYSHDPLIEGITPTPDALLDRGQPVD